MLIFVVRDLNTPYIANGSVTSLSDSVSNLSSSTAVCLFVDTRTVHLCRCWCIINLVCILSTETYRNCAYTYKIQQTSKDNSGFLLVGHSWKSI